ncbi:NUDIX domain-containing protein [Deinococcus radiophilus]|uniref:NUDIX domain-containing protein n=2 Tax=Deinococcus radiophilus TaxID=32062 RepID=A0A431VV11_9DEIO|nr:NUDIX domain-containing protein [Deinococcus radiophilus]RTR27044.1 NUDIX domain-containing protein [Deinococcus radiophilus]UFA50173.1 NUDIX domain-containing protein [Deinococcus radiophilus]
MIRLPTMEDLPGLLRRVQGGAVCSERVTVKAVIWQGGQLGLLHSPRWGCYKFPGGVEPGEDHAAALTRELREETGAELLELGPCLLTVTELAPAQEPEAEVFQMGSFCYACQVTEAQHSPALETYEAELGLEPCWVAPQVAAQANAAALRQPGSPRWIPREIAVLRALAGQA